MSQTQGRRRTKMDPFENMGSNTGKSGGQKCGKMKYGFGHTTKKYPLFVIFLLFVAAFFVSACTVLLFLLFVLLLLPLLGRQPQCQEQLQLSSSPIARRKSITNYYKVHRYLKKKDWQNRNFTRRRAYKTPSVTCETHKSAPHARIGPDPSWWWSTTSCAQGTITSATPPTLRPELHCMPKLVPSHPNFAGG